MLQMIAGFLLLGAIFTAGAAFILLAMSVIFHSSKPIDYECTLKSWGLVFATAAHFCFSCFLLLQQCNRF